MNKGLELIEAHHLFQLPSSRIDVVVHPQSIIHGMVTSCDGSVLAHLGSPDMRTPIAYALGWPGRTAAPTRRLDLADVGRLTFEAPDEERFPALRLAREVLARGGAGPTVLNAANETAVHAFLAGRIGFLDIAATVERTLELMPAGNPRSAATSRCSATAMRVPGCRSHGSANSPRPSATSPFPASDWASAPPSSPAGRRRISSSRSSCSRSCS